MSRSLIKFSESCHWYTKEAKPQHDADLRVARKELLYPSITSVDKFAFTNAFLEKWKLNQLAEAAGDNMRQPHENVEQFAQRIYEISMEKSAIALEFGKAIHDAIEKYPIPPSSEFLPWFLEFERWYVANVANSISTESVVLDHQIGLAGRMDLKALLTDGRLALVDFKTQGVKVDPKGKKKPAFYDSWARQLAFYAVADAKNQGTFPTIPVCISLIIDSSEGGKIYHREWTKQEIIDAYEALLHGFWIWCCDHIRGYWPTGNKWMVRDIPLPI